MKYVSDKDLDLWESDYSVILGSSRYFTLTYKIYLHLSNKTWPNVYTFTNIFR